jgi:hypothetical protein
MEYPKNNKVIYRAAGDSVTLTVDGTDAACAVL